MMMPILDVTEFDFSQEHARGDGQVARRVAVVRNPDARAVLHVGVRSPVPWLEVYPSEFALAPQESQTVTAELRPERARNAALAPATVSVLGQYLAIAPGEAPPEEGVEISVIPPIAACPHCGAELPEGARECRRCGERLRLCPVCGTPNTWLARVCRRSPAHVLRTETDWRMAPGGDPSHGVAPETPLGVHLARRWSSPSFPVSRAEDVAEWSAPLAAFGMVIASAIEPALGRATIQAFELTTGAALWDFDLPDARGIYPDRGAMALSEDGLLYAATLGGAVVALDAIRGTRRWESRVAGTVYGGVTVADDCLLVPAGDAVCVLDRRTGALEQTLPLGGRLDTAPASAEGTVFATCDDGHVYAFTLAAGDKLWQTAADGPFDAAPLVRGGVVHAATMAGTVYALDAATGGVKWRTSATARPIAVTPALSADGLLFVAADDGFLHVIAAETGNLIRSRRVSPSPLRASPVCSGHTVFVGADDGNIYALDAEYAVQRAYETTPGARLATAGFALYGDTLACAATNGVLYVLRATP
ncbi:MAG: PQQ-binding-like beta-propeller repeat protein [Armatimonadetes bacterium]|nr:PQQ-binding-like beta-propeller repeat protein [Armatimonadota bacterium]